VGRSVVAATSSVVNVVPRAVASSTIKPASIFVRGDQPPPLFIDEKVAPSTTTVSSIPLPVVATQPVSSVMMTTSTSTLPKSG
jgi:hypothetical protein